MIPIQANDAESTCRPEWVKMNHLLSYCTRPMSPTGDANDGEATSAPRCNHQDCLFSAKRL